MTVGNRIQSAHPTIGYREMQQQFIKIFNWRGPTLNMSKDAGLKVTWLHTKGKTQSKGTKCWTCYCPLPIRTCASQTVQRLNT